MSLERVKGFLEYIRDNNILHGVDPSKNLEQLAADNRAIYGADFSQFRNARFVFIAFSSLLGRDPDEYCTISASRECSTHLASLGAMVVVKEYGTKKLKGKEAHDLLNLPTSILSQWLKR